MLNTHFETALSIIISHRKDHDRYKADPLRLLGLLFDTSTNPDAVPAALARCIAADWSEGAAFVMERRSQKNFAHKCYDLDF